MAALEVRSQKPRAKSQKRDEELLERIDPAGRLVRVNLRPFAERCRRQSARGKMQDAEWLVSAMVESARRVKGDSEQMRRRLAAAVRWCRKNLPRQAADVERIAARAEESGYPAFHHSPAYTRAYRPAYRVVLVTCLSRKPALPVPAVAKPHKSSETSAKDKV
jgi:hypothetical protein